MDQVIIRKWIEINCPLLWSIINQRAQKDLPKGLIEYSGGGDINVRTLKLYLKPLETVLRDLESICGSKSLRDTYRRDFSGANSGNQISELFCEIAICASLGKISGGLKLRPKTERGTHSDCLINLNNFNIYAEVKRFVDPWPPIDPLDIASNKEDKKSYKRSICQLDEKPQGTARPRSMDLRSKLRNVHRQFPEYTINVLFLFHKSIGDSNKYLTSALFGDTNFLKKSGYTLEQDGLFSDEEWRNISVCCLPFLKIDYDNSKVEVDFFPFAWENPRAFKKLPRPILEALIKK